MKTDRPPGASPNWEVPLAEPPYAAGNAIVVINASAG